MLRLGEDNDLVGDTVGDVGEIGELPSLCLPVHAHVEVRVAHVIHDDAEAEAGYLVEQIPAHLAGPCGGEADLQQMPVGGEPPRGEQIVIGTFGREINQGTVEINVCVDRQLTRVLEAGAHRPGSRHREPVTGIVHAFDCVNAALRDKPLLEGGGVMQQRAVEVGDDESLFRVGHGVSP